MAAFGGLIQTNRGRNLQAKAQTGIQLNFTRIAIGDGNLSGQQISDLTALISQKKTLSISKLKTQTGGKAVVGCVLSNQDIVTGFYFREIGVFAQDPDLGEILYCYGNAGQGAEYIPAGGGPDVIEKNIDIITLIGNATNVSATIESSLIFETPQGAQDKANTAETNAKNASVPKTEKGVANGVATLGSDGKIPSTQLPALAITETYVINTQAAMLALTAQVGDVAIRSDINKNFILRAEPASTLANWAELLTPTDTVLSVNGKTGALTLSASDVGAASEQDFVSHSADSTTGAHKAKNIDLEDTGNKFTSTNVEGALNELFQNVSDGKISVRDAITGNGGTVADADVDGIPTFQELIDAILSIVGDYKIGDIVLNGKYEDSFSYSDNTLESSASLTITASSTDGSIYDIDVDKDGNVYVAIWDNSVTSNNRIQKFGPTGAIISNGPAISSTRFQAVAVHHDANAVYASGSSLNPYIIKYNKNGLGEITSRSGAQTTALFPAKDGRYVYTLACEKLDGSATGLPSVGGLFSGGAGSVYCMCYDFDSDTVYFVRYNNATSRYELCKAVPSVSMTPTVLVTIPSGYNPGDVKSMAVGNGVVAIGTYQGTILLYNALTGALLKHNTSTGSPSMIQAVIWDGTRFICTGYNRLAYIFNSAGDLLFTDANAGYKAILAPSRKTQREFLGANKASGYRTANYLRPVQTKNGIKILG